MEGNATNLVNALTNLVNRYNRNMGYTYSVNHNQEDKCIAVICNPTNAIINDVRMVAEAFLKDGHNGVRVNGFMPMIEIYYGNKRNFKKEPTEYLLMLVGAVPMEE
jgi:hypothetical protein